MGSHTSAHAGSRSLCEGLVRELASIETSIVRSESGETCGCKSIGKSLFAFIYHYKHRSQINVYFRHHLDDPLSGFPSEIPIKRRPNASNPWAKTFPSHFILSDQADLPSVARFLIDVAYPMTNSDGLKASKAKKRPMEALAEEILSTAKLTEGAMESIIVNRYERNREARQKCIKHFGTICCVCSFDFGDYYGSTMRGFIHVHHLRPLASVGKEYVIDPIKDLRPICPNCHAVVHRNEPPLELEEVKKLLRGARSFREDA